MEHGSIFYIKNYTLNRNHLTTFFSAKFEDETIHIDELDSIKEQIEKLKS